MLHFTTFHRVTHEPVDRMNQQNLSGRTREQTLRLHGQNKSRGVVNPVT